MARTFKVLFPSSRKETSVQVFNVIAFSVFRGIVKCLYDRAKHLITKPSVISEEKKHLSSVLVSNGYPSSFIRKLAKTTRPTANNEPTQEFKSAVLPYIKGVSEVLRQLSPLPTTTRRSHRL